MKQEEYRKTVEQIKADSDVKERIWEEIEERKVEGKKKNKESDKKLGDKVNQRRLAPLYWAAALLVVCGLFFTVPVVASEIQSWIIKMKPEYNSVSDKIETGVYSKSDGHVAMTVVELLSDEQNVYMTVKYEALDKEGEKWLAEENFVPSQGGDLRFCIYPYMEEENWGEHLVNWAYDSREFTELATDTERWFYLYYEASSRDYHSGQGKFVYPMSEGYEETYLDTTGNVDVFLYELTGGTSPNEYYQPTNIQLSELSYTIYAMQNGVYTRETSETHTAGYWYLPDEELNKIHSSIYFVMEDGEKIQPDSGWMNGAAPCQENGYSNLVLSSNIFEQELMENIDIEKIVGVEIQGVYYDIQK